MMGLQFGITLSRVCLSVCFLLTTRARRWAPPRAAVTRRWPSTDPESSPLSSWSIFFLTKRHFVVNNNRRLPRGSSDSQKKLRLHLGFKRVPSRGAFTSARDATPHAAGAACLGSAVARVRSNGLPGPACHDALCQALLRHGAATRRQRPASAAAAARSGGARRARAGGRTHRPYRRVRAVPAGPRGACARRQTGGPRMPLGASEREHAGFCGLFKF